VDRDERLSIDKPSFLPAAAGLGLFRENK